MHSLRKKRKKICEDCYALVTIPHKCPYEMADIEIARRKDRDE